MTTEPTITCPKCGTQIKLTESLAAPMVAAARAEMQERIDIAINQAEEVQRKATSKEAQLEATITERVAAEARRAETLAKKHAEDAYGAKFSELDNEVVGLRQSLATAQQAQAEAVRKERELEGRERAITLTIEQGITEGVQTARLQAKAESDDANRLRLLEKEMLIESMQKKVTELQQKIEQGSQQMQGESQELNLQATLTSAFPFDVVGEVGKGINGADVAQTVIAPSGAECGLILYESKRTRNWSAGWLPKLREDGRKAHADVLVLVSTALPEEVETFNQIDNVWVCAPSVALPLATALRATLLAVHASKQAQEGMKTKSEEVYTYVTGPQFRHRVEALVEAFTTMQDDLATEQKATQRQWAKRAVQIERVMTSTSGMFGDLQGIAGKALPEPEGLALGGGE